MKSTAKKPMSSPPGKYRTARLPSGATRREFAGLVGQFTSEAQIEDYLKGNFTHLGLNAVLVGAQLGIGDGKAMDMLALREDGSFCVVELKRDTASRDALAQILEYSRLLRQMVRAEINGVFREKTGRTLDEFYTHAFSRPLPNPRPEGCLLVILADSFDPDTERLALYLNQHHRFQIKLVAYEFPQSDGESRAQARPIFEDLLNPHDRLPGVGELPSNTLLVRVQEHHDQSWLQSREWGSALCLASGEPAIQSSIHQGGDTTVLAYLDRAGFVGVGTLKGMAAWTPAKPLVKGRKDQKLPIEPALIKLEVQWEVTVPRERAHFISKCCQPGESAQELRDQDVWAEALGVLRLRAKRAGGNRRGTRRYPFKQKDKGAANTGAAPAVLEQQPLDPTA
jgi:hypothetical protein